MTLSIPLLRRATMPLLGLGLLLLVALPVLAQEPVEVRLDPTGSLAVRGTAALTATNGGTIATLDIAGLPAGTLAVSQLHAGSCAQPSASFAAMPFVTADTTGRGTATGPVRFRGDQDVPLQTFVDGDHVIVVTGFGLVLACGSIPRVALLPAAGEPGLLPPAGLLVALALLVLSGGLLLRRA